MKPYTRSIFDLFDGKRRYEVPLFQRQYVWKHDEHWEPLWEDIERKFIQRLDGAPSTPHFLGAMVLDQFLPDNNGSTHGVILAVIIMPKEFICSVQDFIANSFSIGIIRNMAPSRQRIGVSRRGSDGLP
jgi:hypothetical protein